MIYSKENMRSLVRKFNNHGPVQPEDVKQLADFIALMFDKQEDMQSTIYDLEREVRDLKRK